MNPELLTLPANYLLDIFTHQRGMRVLSEEDLSYIKNLFKDSRLFGIYTLEKDNGPWGVLWETKLYNSDEGVLARKRAESETRRKISFGKITLEEAIIQKLRTHPVFKDQEVALLRNMATGIIKSETKRLALGRVELDFSEIWLNYDRETNAEPPKEDRETEPGNN